MSTPFPNGTLRIVVVDDFPPLRETLRQLFAEFTDLEVVGEAGDGHSAIEMTLHLVPEVIVMDVKMPRLNGVEATRRINEPFRKFTWLGSLRTMTL